MIERRLQTIDQNQDDNQRNPKDRGQPMVCIV
jgi:hypothetical protein